MLHDGVEQVMVPVEEYERLVKADMAARAIAEIQREGAHKESSEWVDAARFGLELAGQTIADARKAAGLTQKQLGRKLGLPQSQISRIERNPDHTTVRTLKKVAKALGVNIRAFVAMSS